MDNAEYDQVVTELETCDFDRGLELLERAVTELMRRYADIVERELGDTDRATELRRLAGETTGKAPQR